MGDTPADRDGPRPMPAGLGTVAPRELAQAGFTDLRQLTEVTAKELLALHGVGPKAVRILREALTSEGLSFREE